MLRTDPINPPADEVRAEPLRARALKKTRLGRLDREHAQSGRGGVELQEADLVGALNRGMPMAAFRIGLVALPEWIKMRRENGSRCTARVAHAFEVVEPFALSRTGRKVLRRWCANDHLSWMAVPRDEMSAKRTEGSSWPRDRARGS